METKKMLCLKSGVNIEITREQEKEILNTLNTKEEYIQISGITFGRKEFKEIVSSNSIEDAERRKKGDWYCENCERYHGRFDKCTYIPDHRNEAGVDADGYLYLNGVKTEEKIDISQYPDHPFNHNDPLNSKVEIINQ